MNKHKRLTFEKNQIKKNIFLNFYIREKCLLKTKYKANIDTKFMFVHFGPWYVMPTTGEKCTPEAIKIDYEYTVK